jgi:hypothetical protein
MMKEDESSKGEERAVLPKRVPKKQPQRSTPSVVAKQEEATVTACGKQRWETLVSKQEELLRWNTGPSPRVANMLLSAKCNSGKTAEAAKADDATTDNRKSPKAKQQDDDVASTDFDIPLPAPLVAASRNVQQDILPGAFRMRPCVEPTLANGLAEGEQEESRRSVFSAGIHKQASDIILLEATLVDQEIPASSSSTRTSDRSEPQQHPLPVVPEPELVMGHPMNPKETEALKQSRRQDHKKWRWIVVGLVCFLFVFLVVLGIALGVFLSKKQPPASSEQGNLLQTTIGQEEIPTPTMAPTAFGQEVLPLYSQEALKDPATPQAQAFEWVQKDLQHNLETDNLEIQAYFPLQRMALATLYYALGGPHWTDQEHWLEEESDPCDWYTTFYGSVCAGNTRNTRRAKRKLRRRDVLEDDGRRYYQQLSLFKNNLVGRLPAEIGILSKLDVVNLHGNSIRGSVPSEMGLWRDVTFLQLFNNSLTGTLPSQLGQLEQIWHLNFAFNELSGAIPIELGQLSSTLQVLSISNNKITGIVPTELGSLTKLEGLHLYGNPALAGLLPTELGLLVKMEEIQLQNTSIRGPVPSELGLLSRLTRLVLHSTNLSGILPQEVCALMSTGVLEEISVDCERVTCLDCTCDCSKLMLSEVDDTMSTPADVAVAAGELVTDTPIQVVASFPPEGESSETEAPSTSVESTSAEIP